MTPEEQAVIDAAVAMYRAGAESGEEYALGFAVERYLGSIEEAPVWVPRTWADVRAHDHVRMPGTEVTDVVLLPPLRAGWHIVPGANRFGDRPGRWSEVIVTMEKAGERSMNPAAPVEILLAPSEVAAIELLGWDNREETK